MNRPKGEQTIFAEALRLPPQERAAYLAQATMGDPELRQEVEALLSSYAAGEFLEHAAAPEIRPAAPLTERAGDTIGRYKLLQQIGEGGCGVVYMAEQEEPFHRRVALKIIKLGMDTRSVIARFEAERQALAMMDHPNIARVLDAGATDTGRPYFVMELVRGMKITDYCDEKKLPTRQRLDLFIQVCQAIQHAHQKGIIHRDIKPSNILVTINDGVPVPKVIDFGIAKATGGLRLTDRTLFTAFEQFIGTPAYMSPEQAVLTSLDIDTRSDIYALGVLLYELLTGRTPFDAKELLAIGLDEMRRTIREQEPPRPSTRLSTLAQNELSTTAQRRGLDAPKLVTELRGDLDWIVMKALEKDRARRYETANGLAADVQRHLNNEPVVACPPSTVYRLQKTIHRNKLAFAAAASVVAALTVGFAVSTWRFLKEREALSRAVAAEQAAKEERDSAKAVLNFFQDHVLAAGRPQGQAGGLGKDVTLRQAIDAAESQIAKAFQHRPLVEAAIRNTLGQSYKFLGEGTLAIRQTERALTLRRQHLGLDHPDTFDGMDNLGYLYAQAGNFEQGLAFLEAALKWRKETLGPAHLDTLESMNHLTFQYYRAGKPERAVEIGQEALKLSKVSFPDHHVTRSLMNHLGLAYMESGQSDKAIALLQETLTVFQAKEGLNHPDTLTVINNLALAFSYAGKADRAVPLYQQAFELKKAKLGLAHPSTRATINGLASAYRDIGLMEQALQLSTELVRLSTDADGPSHPDTINAINGRHAAFRRAGKLDQLEAIYRNELAQQSNDTFMARYRLGQVLLERASVDGTSSVNNQRFIAEGGQLLSEYLAEARVRHMNDPLELARSLQNVAELRYRQGNYAEATPLYREMIELRRPRLGPEHKDILESTASLARLLSDWAWAERTNTVAAEVTRLTSSSSSPYERARQAERLLRDVLAVRLRATTNSWRIGDVQSRLGAALLSVAVTDPTLGPEARTAQLTQAESLLVEGFERLQSTFRNEKYKRDALQRLVRLYEAWDKPDKRAQWEQKLEEFDKAKPLIQDFADATTKNSE